MQSTKKKKKRKKISARTTSLPQAGVESSKLGSGTAVIIMIMAEFKKFDLNFGGISETKKLMIINGICRAKIWK